MENNQNEEIPEMHKAVMEGLDDVVEALLIQGADPNEKNSKTYRAAAHCAVQTENLTMLRLLQARGANMNSLDSSLNTPLYEAAENGKIKSLEWLMDNVVDLNTDQSKAEAILIAAFNGQVEAVSSLLRRGASLESKFEMGRTPLYQAVEMGRLDMVKFLLGRGADARIRDEYGKTLMHAAAESGDVDTVRLVLEHHKDLNVKDEGGNTPLHSAVLTNEEVVSLLLDSGADMNAQDGDGRTPLFIAMSAGKTEIAELLRTRQTAKTCE